MTRVHETVSIVVNTRGDAERPSTFYHSNLLAARCNFHLRAPFRVDEARSCVACSKLVMTSRTGGPRTLATYLPR